MVVRVVEMPLEACANRGHERAHEVLVEAKSFKSVFKIFVEAVKEHEEALIIAITFDTV